MLDSAHCVGELHARSYCHFASPISDPKTPLLRETPAHSNYRHDRQTRRNADLHVKALPAEIARVERQLANVDSVAFGLATQVPERF